MRNDGDRGAGGRQPQRLVQTGPVAAPSARTPGPEDRRAFLRLSPVVAVRSVAFIGLSTLIALYVRERGGGATAAAGAVALFALFAGSPGGTLLGGRPASRRGRATRSAGPTRRPLRPWRACCACRRPWVSGCPAPAATALYVPFSLQVPPGQGHLPARMRTASGVPLGLRVTVGGVASPLIGALADATSVRTALLLPLPAWAPARRLPEPAPGA
ncbi:hypothetical protein [Streptomyces sp. NPDC051109]|uniref:hypothetical protein n=1 Tax=Streptomyces sp. NPDC051109 TaxID=3365642 RepID=UPI001064DF0C